jgi:hypothetical protein
MYADSVRGKPAHDDAVAVARARVPGSRREQVELATRLGPKTKELDLWTIRMTRWVFLHMGLVSSQDVPIEVCAITAGDRSGPTLTLGGRWT